MRYQILQNVFMVNQISVLLISHHADDQIVGDNYRTTNAGREDWGELRSPIAPPLLISGPKAGTTRFSVNHSQPKTKKPENYNAVVCVEGKLRSQIQMVGKINGILLENEEGLSWEDIVRPIVLQYLFSEGWKDFATRNKPKLVTVIFEIID
ncbi:hypothetical protein MKW98_015887 [Papaver atlanticum]|uniref:Uncharacterized protein n=1 Tax=Papaver atlanticum TaxID=357466 RepID=A0AAD4STG2_9MAGN|nr:hypothetical protein MKW98_015887 [Papaver atlanticum]